MPAQTLFVASLPVSASNQRLEEIFSEIGPVKQCFVVKDRGSEKCRGFGYVTYSLEEDAQRAMKEIKHYDGQKILLTVAKKKMKDKRKSAPKEPPAAAKGNEQKSKGIRKSMLKAKLIIRNLSFKCSEDDLKQIFSKFGAVLEVKIPLKPDGKMRGFAFVLFKSVSQAGKALNAMNLKEIKGRQVAIDWAVPKDKYEATQSSSSPANKNVEEITVKEPQTKSDVEEEEDSSNEASPAKEKVKLKQTEKHVKKFQPDDEEDSEEQTSEENEDGDKETDDDISEEGDNDDKCDLSSDDDDHDEDEEEDDDDDEEEDDDDEEESDKKKPPKKTFPSDVKEGRTIFIRNLAFDTEEEDLEKVLLQYGELNYIKIVLHPDTEHSKGCAFAQFKTKEAAEKCIAEAQDEKGGIRLDGRKLLIVAAVSREDATKLKGNKVKVETGTRNLYLAREGFIRAGTKAAEGVPEADMIKRARFEEIKRTKLRDQNVFVSKNRLCIHNLPKSVDNKKLKSLCLQALKGAKGVRITECRVMYDKRPEKGQVMGQSLGYAFVQFQEHEHTLTALRYLNNNPDIFGSHKRPIVEFSLEDSRKLKMKEIRQQKNKDFLQNRPLKVLGKPQTKTPGDTKGPRSQDRKRRLQIRVVPQKQKQDSHYSGFQTITEVEHVELNDGKKRRKVLPFPSHRGAKIRMRDKGKRQNILPKRNPTRCKKKEHRRRPLEKSIQPRTQKAKAERGNYQRRHGDHFESLVEQYKKKLMGSSTKNTSIRTNKWFDN
ncbi:LOW QUALITY PROTEIN: RNA-binding protein 28 [Thalassophryne amazonica]|uniref:LOW QUALITY PROTEIN: RNA-binding protein 28 n=1 Tax=Thalassophryne amazonica TaxID=390379 RepID=UPI0014716EE8|nr:LOW QUALITY PROTEIN: RNA-binding protein 28 [Thalassophryne amazonica]